MSMPQEEDKKRHSLPVSEVQELMRIEAEECSLSEIMSLVPTAMLGLIGKIVYPRDGGLLISEAIVAGECMGASDGSLRTGFKKIRGGHGYALRHKDNNNKIQFLHVIREPIYTTYRTEITSIYHIGG